MDTEAEVMDATLEGPFAVAMFVRDDGTWSVHTTLDQLATLEKLNHALRQASAGLS